MKRKTKGHPEVLAKGCGMGGLIKLYHEEQWHQGLLSVGLLRERYNQYYRINLHILINFLKTIKFIHLSWLLTYDLKQYVKTVRMSDVYFDRSTIFLFIKSHKWL